MEIDVREVPASQHLAQVLSSFPHLERGEVLTLLCNEDPEALVQAAKQALGVTADIQKIRWGVKDQPWILHLKRSLKPSAYHGDQ
jgi:uncharacterized protein (DUF2249 family)